MSERSHGLSVLHVSEPVDGGVARCIVGLADDQSERGWRVGVLSPEHEPFRAAVERSGAEHRSWQLPVRLASDQRSGLATRSLLAQLGPLKKAIEVWDPDVLHLHSSVAGLAARIALRGCRPTVFQPHAWSFLAVAGVVRRAAIAWERIGARWADVIICVSEAERRLGEAARIQATYRVVPNGVDLGSLTEASPADRAAARARLGLTPGPLVVSVGALRRQKGQDVLLEAWSLVRARVPDATLVLVGDGPDRAELEAQAGAGVLVVGFRSGVPDWLAAADVVALPSRWEGMSYVLLEAMARGRSVVASDAAGAREALDGAGAVVPVAAVEPLANAIAQRLADPIRAAREGRQARMRAERFHDLAGACGAVARLYADLRLGASGGPRAGRA